MTEKTDYGNIPAIGQPWPGQGGVNGGLMRGEDGPDYWLIMPTDKTADLDGLEYGSPGEDEPGACSQTDGMANTRALVASKHSHPAAEACASLTLDGHSDFYLPAIRELNLLRATVPELFQKCWHLSSTQYSADGAWGQTFLSGYQGDGHKDYKHRVRAVRRVSALTL